MPTIQCRVPDQPGVLLSQADSLDPSQWRPASDVDASAAKPIAGAVGGGPLRLVLPYPPSANRIWRSIVIRGAVRVLISREGHEYRRDVKSALGGRTQAAGACLTGPVAVQIAAYPPDRRRRDLDNILKAALDALTHAGVWADDSLIAALRVERMGVSDRPRLEVIVEPMAVRQQELIATEDVPA